MIRNHTAVHVLIDTTIQTVQWSQLESYMYGLYVISMSFELQTFPSCHEVVTDEASSSVEVHFRRLYYGSQDIYYTLKIKRMKKNHSLLSLAGLCRNQMGFDLFVKVKATSDFQ